MARSPARTPAADMLVMALALALVAVMATVAAAQATTVAPAEEAATYRERWVLFETRTLPSEAWVRVGRAPADARISPLLALRHHDLDRLERIVSEVSDPRSPKYGKYLTYEQVCAEIAPPPADVDALIRWLVTEERVMSGGSSTRIVRLCDAVQLRTDVATAERLFQTTFHVFRHGPSGRTLVRHWGALSLPAHVAPLVQTVLGVREFRRPRHHAHRLPASGMRVGTTAPRPAVNSDGRCVGSNGVQLGTCPVGVVCCIDFNQTGNALKCCNQGQVCQAGMCVDAWVEPQTNLTFPQTWQDLYNVPQSGIAPDAARTPVAIVAFNDYYDVPSTELYTAAFGKPYPSIQHYCPSVTSPYFGPDPFPCSCVAQGCDTGESNLDVQCVSSLGTGLPLWFWAMQNPNDWMVEWLTSVLAAVAGTAPVPLATPLPTVFSISYGDTEINTPAEYRIRADVMLQQMAAMGKSVFVADGDNGAQSEPGTPGGAMINPEWPTSSPWVTSVGATQLSDNPQPGCGQRIEHRRRAGSACFGERVSSAATASAITSGGGFSSIYARPSYQSAAVRAYTQSGIPLPNSTRAWAVSNRGYPDVTAIGAWLASANLGEFNPVFGTSASTPILAGLFARLNAELVNAGGQPLGFLNPFLYQMAAEAPQVFNDIVDGDNACGTRDQDCQPEGYLAATGWDAVSGLGSLNYPRLREYAFRKQGLLGGQAGTPPMLFPALTYASLATAGVALVLGIAATALTCRRRSPEAVPLINH